MKKPITKESALQRLASLCSRSEQCESDLLRKLFNWGLGKDDRNEILEYLRENRFVDEERFARSFANDKARFSAWGPAKIRMELFRRKIASDKISMAINNVDAGIWKEGLLKNAMTKAKTLDLTGEESREEKQKLFRYLISRGFPTSASSKMVEHMIQRQKEQNEEMD